MDAETSSQSAHRTPPIPFDLGNVHVITIGIDPHKLSHTAVAVDAAGHQLAQRRFVVNAGTVRQLMRWCERWPERRFAVEGAKGLGRSLAQQLASAGEHVVDVPSTLSARARLLATGGDRKTDAADALHVAQVALFRHDLRKVEPEDQSMILRLLTERHDDLVNERTRIINRLHAVLRDLLPGGAPTHLSAEKAAALMTPPRLLSHRMPTTIRRRWNGAAVPSCPCGDLSDLQRAYRRLPSG
ncbi:transposase [Streptomyces sp. SCSIO 30461]|uniref:IS110 family transposase n=1 Tax=Streptomyces sp. SCSIO 30461 TaxID=3118085 RepID=UPI0030D4847B